MSSSWRSSISSAWRTEEKNHEQRHDLQPLRRRHTSYVEWGPVLAGATLACAISIVLLQFGSAIGLAVSAPLRGEGLARPGLAFATGLWILWVQITASIGGGYLAGRLRRSFDGIADHESEVRDGAHGLLSWAAATVAVFIGVSAATAVAALAPAVATPDQTADATQAMMVAKKNAAAVYAFVTGAVSLVSAVSAWWAATKGGEHRDGQVDFSRHFSFRKR